MTEASLNQRRRTTKWKEGKQFLPVKTTSGAWTETWNLQKEESLFSPITLSRWRRQRASWHTLYCIVHMCCVVKRRNKIDGPPGQVMEASYSQEHHQDLSKYKFRAPCAILAFVAETIWHASARQHTKRRKRPGGIWELDSVPGFLELPSIYFCGLTWWVQHEKQSSIHIGLQEYYEKAS